MSVPTVPNRSLQHFGTRSSHRSHRSPPSKEGERRERRPSHSKKTRGKARPGRVGGEKLL